MDLEGLIGELEAVVAVDPRSLLDDTLCQRELQLDRLRNLVGVAEARSLGELEVRRATDVALGMRTSGWLTYAAKVAPGAARRRVKVAVTLRGALGEVHGAWMAGSINEHHVAVLHDAANPRIEREIAARQAELIALAGEYSFVQWRQIVVNLVAILDQDGAFDPDAERERNQAAFSSTLDGSCSLAARFDRVTYGTVRHLVEEKADELHRHYRERAAASDGALVVPSRSTLRALAIFELIVAGAAAAESGATVTDATVVLTPDLVRGASPGPATPAEPAERSGSRGSPFRGTIDGADPGAGFETEGPVETAGPTDVGGPSRSWADLVRRLGLGELADLGDEGGFAYLPDLRARDGFRGPADPAMGSAGHVGHVGGWRAWTLDGLLLPGASPELAARLCDAAVHALVVDPDGRPLSMGRSVRLFQDHQRRAIDIRDGGCVMPACTIGPSGCTYHHLEQWDRDRGPTDVDNGAGLCRRDHGVAHRTGWDTFITADGWTWFRAPSGRSFWGQRHGRQRTGPTPDQPGYPRSDAPDADAGIGPTPAVRPPPRTGDAPTDPSPVPTPSLAGPDPGSWLTRPPPGQATLERIRCRLRHELIGAT